MKKSIAKLFGILAISGVVLTSCSSSDDDEPTSSFQLVPSNFKGDINDGQVILNASTVYTLTGRLVVNEGAELVIPARNCNRGYWWNIFLYSCCSRR